MQLLFPVLFVVLFCSVFFWFFLCHRLFNRLATHHPDKYRAMGEPDLFRNNTGSTNATFLKFLWKREWRQLDDPALAKLGGTMRVFAAFYLTGFLLLFLGAPFVYTT